MQLNEKVSFATFLFLSIGLCVLSVVWFPPNIIAWDVFGYYLYLPLTFIYNDLQLHHPDVIRAIIEQYDSSTTFYQAFELPNGNWVMKYSIGMALLYLPAFAFGHLVAIWFEYPVDGFSYPYQLGMFLEMLVVIVLSAWYLRKVLLHFFSDKLTAALLVFILLGTNYLINTTLIGAGSGTQSYLFLLYCLILLHSIRWHNGNKLKDMLLLGVFCGLAILARPSELVCLFIPLLWNVTSISSAKQKFSLLLSHWKQLLGFSAVLLCIGSFQLIYWKYVSGSFIHYSYGGDAGAAFSFNKPHIINVLFSYRKGWFVYTPMMFLATVGLILAAKKKVGASTGVIVYAVLNLWIISSWHCWWYAESFGQRSLVQSYPVMALGLGMLFSQGIPKSVRTLAGTFATAALALSLFQSWQFRVGVVEASRATEKYYWATFWDTEPRFEHDHLKLVQRDGWNGSQMKDESEYFVFEFDNYSMEDGRVPDWTTLDTNIAWSGKQSAFLTGEHSGAMMPVFSDLTSGHYVWFRVSAYVYPVKPIEQHPISLVMAAFHENSIYGYQETDSETIQLETGKWNKITMNYLSPEMRFSDDIFKAYIWNRGFNELYIDDFKLEVFVPRFDPER